MTARTPRKAEQPSRLMKPVRILRSHNRLFIAVGLGILVYLLLPGSLMPGGWKLPTRMLIGFLNGATPAYLDCEFNLVDARDAANGHLLAAERGRIGERYILGGENLALGHVLDLLREMTGLPIARTRVPYALAYVAGWISEGLSRLTKRPPIAPLTGVVLARSSMAFFRRLPARMDARAASSALSAGRMKRNVRARNRKPT